MTETLKKNPAFYNAFTGCVLAGLFIFILGFLLHSGKQAYDSGSWQYVTTIKDDALYWGYAKSRVMTSHCEGNPFYYEDRGTRPVIPCTVAEIIGLMSKYTGIPLSWFFPLWYILAPFLVWLILFVCCWRLWNYPLGISATVPMLLLLSTLFCPWPVWPILWRFSRPMDGIGLLFVWISLIFKGNPESWKQKSATALVSALALWMQPFYAVFGLWITGLEGLRLFLRGAKGAEIRLHLYALGGSVISGLLLGTYVVFGQKKNLGSLTEGELFAGTPLFSLLMASLLFLLILAAVLFCVFFLKAKATALDRLVLEWASFGVLVYVYSLFETNKRLAIHMFYFFPIMALSFTGWVHEKLCLLKGSRYYSWLGIIMAGVAGPPLVFFAITQKDPLSDLNMHYYVYMARHMLFLTGVVWILQGVHFLRRAVFRKEVAWGLVLLMAVTGFWKMPLFPANHHFPFAGAYEWLKKNSEKNEVVLIASFKYLYLDYLLFQTGLKSYLNDAGQQMSRKETNDFRMYFVSGLLLNLLAKMPSYEGLSIEQKIRFLKLDYILTPMPTPFLEAITSQLRGHLKEVYQDDRCLLWRVS